MEGMKSKLSILWIFVTLNFLYCDVVTLMNPPTLKEFLTGNVGGMNVSDGFLLAAGMLVEIPMAMVLVSRLANFRVSRWANVVAGAIMTAVQLASLFARTPALYYVFFSIIEIATTSVIVWYAWRWRARVTSSSSSEASPAFG